MTKSKKPLVNSGHSPESTKLALMKAALSLFAKQGYDGTSVKDIAELSGSNIGLISYHFGGKENLYKECVRNLSEEKIALSIRILEPANSAEEFSLRLEMFLTETLKMLVDDPEITKIVLRELEKEEPILRDVFQEVFLPNFQKLVAYLIAAQNKKIIREDVEATIVAGTLMGAIQHHVRMHHLAKRYFKIDVRKPEFQKKIINTVMTIQIEGLKL